MNLLFTIKANLALRRARKAIIEAKRQEVARKPLSARLYKLGKDFETMEQQAADLNRWLTERKQA